MININELKNKILNGELDSLFMSLYGEKKENKQRYLRIINNYEKKFGNQKDVNIFSAPGRTEIIGNHTDHQRGKAIAASVNLDIIGIVSLNSEKVIRILSEGYEEDVISLDDLSVNPEEFNTSKALVKGCAAKLCEMGYKIGGFDMYSSSNVLKGSGLSSSAAFEILIATIMNNLFCDGKENAVSVAKIGKYAENFYFNKPCGMLDQTASSVGGFVYIDFENKENPVIEKKELNLNEYGYSLFVVDTGGNHASLTDEYTAVSAEMKEVSEKLGKEVLGEIDANEFYKKISSLKGNVSDRAILRACHFFDENVRVSEYKEALETGDFNKLISLVKASGKSSFNYLQNVFSVSDITSQGLSLGIYLSERILGDKGAVRVHGGGFAGTIQAYVPLSLAEKYTEEMEKVFGKGCCTKLFVRPAGGIKII